MLYNVVLWQSNQWRRYCAACIFATLHSRVCSEARRKKATRMQTKSRCRLRQSPTHKRNFAEGLLSAQTRASPSPVKARTTTCSNLLACVEDICRGCSNISSSTFARRATAYIKARPHAPRRLVLGHHLISLVVLARGEKCSM